MLELMFCRRSTRDSEASIGRVGFLRGEEKSFQKLRLIVLEKDPRSGADDATLSTKLWKFHKLQVNP